MKVAVFSGRFDPPHIGHVMSIQKLADTHDIVIVPVLDYCNRLITAESAYDVFNSVFEHLHTIGKVIFIVNTTHFAKITYEKYRMLLRDCGIDDAINDVVYYAGNNEVLENMRRVGVRCEYLNRSIDEIYTGTKIKSELIKTLNSDSEEQNS